MVISGYGIEAEVHTLLSPATNEDKLVFLLGDAERFAVLRAWFPNDRRAIFEPLAHKTSTFNSYSAKDVGEAFRLISLHKRTASAVVHPVAKLLATCWQRAIECTKEHNRMPTDGYAQTAKAGKGISGYFGPGGPGRPEGDFRALPALPSLSRCA